MVAPAHEQEALLPPAPDTADTADTNDANDNDANDNDTKPTTDDAWLARNQWVPLAVASGACAAFNGVFAKLTTTELTTRLAQHVAALLGLAASAGAVEVVVRAAFFGLNLVFNGIMWTLFTRALARGTSSTQVSILNTSTNFLLTALLGYAIFAEALPPQWWVGAALLVAGNVIVGRQDEGSTTEPLASASRDSTAEAPLVVPAAVSAAAAVVEGTPAPAVTAAKHAKHATKAQKVSQAAARESSELENLLEN